jgi:hypothetical protein
VRGASQRRRRSSRLRAGSRTSRPGATPNLALKPLSILALVAALVAPAAASAGTDEFTGHHLQQVPVVVVRGLSLADLPQLAQRGAIGLLVPSAGPRTSAALAYAGIVRGVLHNSRLGARPDAPVLIRTAAADAVPAGTRAIVLGLPPNRSVANDVRYPIALLGGCRGVLVSSLTRVPGLVSAADIARTALGTRNALVCRPDAHAASHLRLLEQRIQVARASTLAATVIVLMLLLAFALVLPAGAPAALGSALAANLGLGLFPGGSAAARLTVLALCVVAGGILGGGLVRRPLALGALLLGVVAAHGAALAVQSSSLSLAPLGPELTARFYGVSNVLETLLLVPTLLGAALLARRLGPAAFVAGAAIGLATIAENRLGADGGGAVVLGTAFAVLAVAGTRARLRMLVPALAVAALAVLALLQVDAALTGPDHLSGALGGGVTGLATVLAHRAPLAYARVATQWYLVFPLAALALLAWRTRVWPAARGRRALVAAFAAAIAASLVVNDSPGPVGLAALASFFALEPQALRRELALVVSLPAEPAPAVARSEPS